MNGAVSDQVDCAGGASRVQGPTLWADTCALTGGVRSDAPFNRVVIGGHGNGLGYRVHKSSCRAESGGVLSGYQN